MRAALYARISSDPSGAAQGVERQLQDCRKLAADQGWSVVGEYVDNDISAHSGRVRPEYQRMVNDIRDGLIDAVAVWDIDRLTRQPAVLESFVRLCEAAGMQLLRTVQGGHNLGTTDGLFVARILAAVAANESDKKAQRVRRKMQQNAEAGLPHGGAHRPFGYADDKVTVVPDEAEVIRDLAARFLAGESLASLARAADGAGVPTVSGARWQAGTVRNILKNPRIAGWRAYKGEIVGEAVWDAIISPADSDRIRAILNDPARRTSRSARRFLLAGMLRCGRCGSPLYSHPQPERSRYACKREQSRPGCGRLTINAKRVEELIYQAVLMRLDTPQLADALDGKRASSAVAQEVGQKLAEDRHKAEELAGLWADGQISRDEWLAARKPIEARIRTAERQLAQATNTTALDGLVGNGDALRDSWASLNLDRQRAIVGAILDHAVVQPAPTGGASRFDPARVQPVWRL